MTKNESIVIMEKKQIQEEKNHVWNWVKTKSFVGRKKQTLNEEFKINKEEIFRQETFFFWHKDFS